MDVAFHPGAYKKIDPRIMAPESARRLASGFWKHEHNMESDIDTWICDKRKLHEAVQKALTDGQVFDRFSKDPIGFLDTLFGEGTGEAYRHAGQDRVAMRFDPLGGIRNMATAPTAGTFTTCTTTSGTSDMIWIDKNNAVRHPKDRKTGKPIPASRKTQTKVPFKVETGSNLIKSLQRQFDIWAGQQMELLR